MTLHGLYGHGEASWGGRFGGAPSPRRFRSRSETDRLPGLLAAGDVVAEGARVAAELLRHLERDPLHGDGQLEDRERLTEAARLDAVNARPRRLRRARHGLEPLRAGAAAVEADEHVAL